ncbi:archease [bacterium]|nr:archease [bacterium]
MNSRIQILDHTADIGIRVQADSLQALLVGAGRAMMQIVVENPPAAGEAMVPVCIAFTDYEQLLVNWLSELNYLLQIKKVLFLDCCDAVLTTDHFSCTVRGAAVDAARTSWLTEIKAVTYHNILVQQQADRTWEARAYFDV